MIHNCDSSVARAYSNCILLQQVANVEKQSGNVEKRTANFQLVDVNVPVPLGKVTLTSAPGRLSLGFDRWQPANFQLVDRNL
jgi:hypothetical protein